MLEAWTNVIVSGLIIGGIYAVVAVGLNLQYGLMRILNVAHGEFLMVGAYLTFWGTTLIGTSPHLLMPAVFVVLAVTGFALHAVLFRPLARVAPNPEVFEARGLIVSFGLMFIVQNAALLAWDADLRGGQGSLEAVRLGTLVVNGDKLLACAIALAVGAAMILWLRLTLVGKAVRALMQSPVGATLVGIDVRVLHPLVFGVGLGLAGLAGALISTFYTISPSIGQPYTVTALIVITLGGFGSVSGSLIGGVLLGVIEAVGVELTSPSLKMLLSYLVFVAVLIARPNGLFAR